MHIDPLRADGLREPGGNPWRRTGRREGYANLWIRVHGCASLFGDGTTVLVGRHRDTLGGHSWRKDARVTDALTVAGLPRATGLRLR